MFFICTTKERDMEGGGGCYYLFLWANKSVTKFWVVMVFCWVWVLRSKKKGGNP